MMLRVVLGEPSPKVEGMPDATPLEIGMLAPLVVLTVVVGVYWSSLLSFVDPAVQALVHRGHEGRIAWAPTSS